MSEIEPGSGVTDEDIRRRAYEISQGPDPGTPEENWHRAVEELVHGRAPHDTGRLTGDPESAGIEHSDES